jgi:hypothetical protein
MSRKPAKRRPSRVGFKDWSPAFREIFRLAADNWSPPAAVKVTQSVDGRRITFDARFLQPNGYEVALRTRCRRRADRSVDIVEETASFRFWCRVEAPTQGGGPEALRTSGEPQANGAET